MTTDQERDEKEARNKRWRDLIDKAKREPSQPPATDEGKEREKESRPKKSIRELIDEKTFGEPPKK